MGLSAWNAGHTPSSGEWPGGTCRCALPGHSATPDCRRLRCPRRVLGDDRSQCARECARVSAARQLYEQRSQTTQRDEPHFTHITAQLQVCTILYARSHPSVWPCIYSASSRSQHTLFTLCHSHQTIIITQTHSSILPTCFTSSLEPAPYITQNSSSKLLISLSATFIWTCRYNLLHSAITFYHLFTVSLWAQNLPFQKILSSTLVCLSDWSHGSRPFTGLICSSVLCFSSIFFCISYSQVRQTKLASSLVNY